MFQQNSTPIGGIKVVAQKSRESWHQQLVVRGMVDRLSLKPKYPKYHKIPLWQWKGWLSMFFSFSEDGKNPLVFLFVCFCWLRRAAWTSIPGISRNGCTHSSHKHSSRMLMTSLHLPDFPDVAATKKTIKQVEIGWDPNGPRCWKLTARWFSRRDLFIPYSYLEVTNNLWVPVTFSPSQKGHFVNHLVDVMSFYNVHGLSPFLPRSYSKFELRCWFFWKPRPL